MHTDLLAVAVVLMVGGAGQPQGAVTAVSVDAPAGQTQVVVTVRGNNPCGAVTIDYGDGTKITHALVALPATYSHQYTQPGRHTVRASGNGNCGGDVDTIIQVRPSHVRAPAGEAKPATPALRVAALDAIDHNGDSRIFLEEWKGTEDVFRTTDQNGDGTLSRTEVEDGAVEVFASLDKDSDRRLNPTEWHTARQSFDAYDRNSDGFLTPAEFGVPPAAVGARGRAAGARGRAVDPPEPRATAGPRSKARTTTTVVVRSTERWTDTGLVVQAGDLLTFTATGEIRMSQNADDVATPRGARSGRNAADAPLPDMLAGALIARVGNSPVIFIGGQTDPVRMPRAGRLFLSVNDDALGDNSGTFRVAIGEER